MPFFLGQSLLLSTTVLNDYIIQEGFSFVFKVVKSYFFAKGGLIAKLVSEMIPVDFASYSMLDNCSPLIPGLCLALATTPIA